MKIRKAENRDIPRILSLLLQVNNVHSALRPDLFIKDKTKYGKAELEEIIASEDTPVFVAADEKDDVMGYGFCVCEEHLEENNRVPIKTLYIDDICVDENSRGRHVGRKIYEYIEGFARKGGFHNVTLNVWENNCVARKFYENCGMTVQKTCMEKLL